MKKFLIFTVVIGLCILLYVYLNDSEPKVSVDIDNGIVHVDSKTYEVNLEPDLVYEGYVRLVKNNPVQNLPFITHEVLLTTGDFSDPSKVSVSESGGMQWNKRDNVTGTHLNILMIPEDTSVAERLTNGVSGEDVVFIGSKVVDATINADDGYPVFKSVGSPIFVVTGIIIQ